MMGWPASPSGFVLESKTNLNPALSWSGVTNAVSTNGGTNQVSVIATNRAQFFRLRK
jgi:hypothetical protein